MCQKFATKEPSLLTKTEKNSQLFKQPGWESKNTTHAGARKLLDTWLLFLVAWKVSKTLLVVTLRWDFRINRPAGADPIISCESAASMRYLCVILFLATVAVVRIGESEAASTTATTSATATTTTASTTTTTTTTTASTTSTSTTETSTKKKERRITWRTKRKEGRHIIRDHHHRDGNDSRRSRRRRTNTYSSGYGSRSRRSRTSGRRGRLLRRRESRRL